MNEGAVPVEVNAVFKGGGAKGIAYAGALGACEQAGLEFKAAAGSSAGALIAALVACGYQAQEIADLLPQALGAVDSPGPASLKVWRSSLLSTRPMLAWLRDRIGQRVPSSGSLGPTFADVRAATGRSLYVVAMDLGSRQPVVFSPDLTPDAPVAEALVASSAIPVAFPAFRVRDRDEVRRLIDGGTWANYPHFVFLDADFRSAHAGVLADGAEGRPTVGFVLDAAPPATLAGSTLAPQPGGRLSSDHGSPARTMGPVGAVIGSPLFTALAVTAPIALLVIAFDWLRDQARDGFPFVGWLPDQLETVAVLLVVSGLALAIVPVVAFALLSLRLGRDAAQVGVPSAVAALGVGPSVPYWVGAGKDRHVAVRIEVPTALTTLRFRPGEDVIDAALGAGHAAAAAVLAERFPGAAGRRKLSRVRRIAPSARTGDVRRVRSVLALGALIAVGVAQWRSWPLEYLVPPIAALVVLTPGVASAELSGVQALGFGLLALFGVAALGLQAAEELVAGRLPVSQLVALSLAVMLFVWITSVYFARIAVGDGGALRSVGARALRVVAAVTALLAVGLLAIGLTRGGPTLTDVVRAERGAGTVVGVVGDGRDRRVEVEADIPVAAVVADAAGYRVDDCGEGCWSFRSEREDLDVGSAVDVRYDRAAGLAFLAGDEWQDRDTDLGGYFAALVLLGIAAAAGRELRWRRQHGAAPDGR